MTGDNGKGAVVAAAAKLKPIAIPSGDEQRRMRLEHAAYLKGKKMPPEEIIREMKSLPQTILEGAPS